MILNIFEIYFCMSGLCHHDGFSSSMLATYLWRRGPHRVRDPVPDRALDSAAVSGRFSWLVLLFFERQYFVLAFGNWDEKRENPHIVPDKSSPLESY